MNVSHTTEIIMVQATAGLTASKKQKSHRLMLLLLIEGILQLYRYKWTAINCCHFYKAFAENQDDQPAITYNTLKDKCCLNHYNAGERVS